MLAQWLLNYFIAVLPDRKTAFYLELVIFINKKCTGIYKILCSVFLINNQIFCSIENTIILQII